RARAAVDLLLRHTPLGLAIHDADFRYMRVNHALAQINGVPVHAHRGRTVRQVLGDTAADVLEPLLRQVHETRVPVTVESMRARPRPGGGGGGRFSRGAAARFGDGGGGAPATPGGGGEAAARARAERAREHGGELRQTIIDPFPAMISMFEPNTRVLRLNREF